MSGTGPRESLFPTRMALTNTKLRLKGAQTGHSLLAKKRDALTNRFRAILRKVDEVRPFVPSIVRGLDRPKLLSVYRMDRVWELRFEDVGEWV